MCVCVGVEGERSDLAGSTFDLTPETTGAVPVCWKRSKIHSHTETHACFAVSPQSLDLALKYCNYFFTSMFVLESVLKLIAFGFRRFFKDRCVCVCLRVCVSERSYLLNLQHNRHGSVHGQVPLCAFMHRCPHVHFSKHNLASGSLSPWWES